jgi:hypothetical protein
MIEIKKSGEVIKSFSNVGSMAFWGAANQLDLPKPEWKLWQRINGLMKDGIFDFEEIKGMLVNHFEYEWVED